MRTSSLPALAAVLAACALLLVRSPAPAEAIPVKPVCDVAGLISGVIGKACTLATHGGRLLQGARKLAGGHVGAGVKAILGDGGSKLTGASMAALALAALDHSVVQGAVAALAGTQRLLMRSVSPQLEAPWFNATYWRMAAVASLLTLPFLFACVIQAVLRADLGLLLQAALGYLPLSGLAIAIAAPLTMLVLAATDQLCQLVARGSSGNAVHLLSMTSAASFVTGTPFLMLLLGLLAASAAVVLWVELLIRQAAVLIVVLMLPLVFAALVWPARRIWAVRLIEVLIALILAKFVIVAILTLGGAALGAGGPSAGRLLAGGTLMLLGAGSPWAILRILPHTQAAGSAMGELRGGAGAGLGAAADLGGVAAKFPRSPAGGAEDQEGWAQAEAAGVGPFPEPLPETVPAQESGETPVPAGEPLRAGDDQSSPAPARSLTEIGVELGRQAAARRARLGGEEAARPPRMPGWGEMWQAENMTWDPVVLQDTSPILPLFDEEEPVTAGPQAGEAGPDSAPPDGAA